MLLHLFLPSNLYLDMEDLYILSMYLLGLKLSEKRKLIELYEKVKSTQNIYKINVIAIVFGFKYYIVKIFQTIS